MSSISPAAARIPGDGGAPRLSRLGDELLARQAARGSNRAFTVLYQRYYQPLYRYCRSIVRDDADAQDALQSTFTSALAALQRDARSAPLRPWLYRIAHNESITLLRRRKRDGQHEAVPEASMVGASAEEEAAGRARWQRVVEDLAELPERQRGSLLLRELAGLSHEEIALAFGTTVGGAKQAIFEARQGLAELQEGRAMSCDEVRARISEGDRRLLRARRVNAHLRDCATCKAFAVAIPARQSDLRALAPGLPPAAAAALFGRVLQAASPHAGASAGSAASAAAMAKTAGTVVGWKALATAGVLIATAAGVTGVTQALHHSRATGVRSGMPAAALPPARSRADEVAQGRAAASAGPAAAGLSKAEAAQAADRAHAAARHHRRHHHAASAAHRGAHSSASASGAFTTSAVAGGSYASGSHPHSAPGQVTNHGVRRRGGASTTHVSQSQTHRSSQNHSTPTHPTSQTRSTSSPTATVRAPRTTSSVSHTSGSPTPNVSSQGSSTSSTPVTATTPHAVTGTASK